MARGPQGQWRPDDEIASAIHTMKIATGEIEETFVDEDDDHENNNKVENAIKTRPRS